MKYIRTDYGTIIQCEQDEYGLWCYKFLDYPQIVSEENIVNIADTIEELIQDDDILYIHDLYPDAVLVVEGGIKPYGYNDRILLKDWLEYDWTVFDLYIKNGHDDYFKVASKKEEGKLELC